MYYVVSVIDRNGVVGGSLFDDPVPAIQLFSKYLKKGRCYEAEFRKVGQLTCTLDTDRLTFAEVLTDNQGCQFVEFHAHATLEDMKAHVERHKALFGTGSRYYQKGLVLDLQQDGKVVLSFEEKE